MKKYIYLFILATLIGLTGCVEDAQLTDSHDIKLTISMQKGIDFINLNGSVTCDERRINEKGFILIRNVHSENYWEESPKIEDKFIITNETAFETQIKGLFSDPMDCDVFAYANIDGRIFRSSIINFKMTGDIPIEINSVKIEPHANQISGTITIEGRNFSMFEYSNILTIDTLLNGSNDCSIKEYSTDRLCFNYFCNNIGSFPLRLKKGTQEIKLSQRLQVNGAKLKGFIPEHPRSSEWSKIVLENADNNTVCGYSFSYAYNQPQGYAREINGVQQAVFKNIPNEADIQLWYILDGNQVYMEPKRISFSIPWVETGFKSTLSSIKAVSDGWMYRFLDGMLYRYSPKDNKSETYPAVYPEGYVNSGGDAGVCISGDYAYICHGTTYYASPLSTQQEYCTLILKFNIKTKKWESFNHLSEIHVSGCQITLYENLLLIKLENSDYVIAYNIDSNKWELFSDYSSSNILWVGTYNNYLYYISHQYDNPVLKRVKKGDWTKTEDIYSFLAIDTWSALIYNAWIVDNYLYISGSQMMRIDLSAHPIKELCLGNLKNESVSCILPTPNDIYCMDHQGAIYRYVEDRKE